jgi:hypothetical protein
MIIGLPAFNPETGEDQPWRENLTQGTRHSANPSSKNSYEICDKVLRELNGNLSYYYYLGETDDNDVTTW